MTERWKKFLWTPKFWATLGVIGCATGLYFQGVAANGSGLWCLGLIFLGAAYLEHQESRRSAELNQISNDYKTQRVPKRRCRNDTELATKA